ncbi:MAG: S-layer homology domain-containing protein [Candidatus Gracilibacteria bacterium]
MKKKSFLSFVVLFALSFSLAIPGARAFSFAPIAEAATGEIVVTLGDLQTNLDYLFPDPSYLSGLEYHSTWQEVSRNNMTVTSGIEVTYEALFDQAPEFGDELPTINAYILPMASENAAQLQFNLWAASGNFLNGNWIKKSEGADYFSYYTESATASDLIKYRSLEAGSLHFVRYYDNVIIIVNFYRTAGQYLKNNVSAYLTYLENYEETLSVMNELGVYVEEALKFYLGSTFSVEGPSDYTYHATGATYGLNLSDLYGISRNGNLTLDLYIDDASEIGTILDMKGNTTPTNGSFLLSLNENAELDYQFYAPSIDSECAHGDGWHTISSGTSLDLYEWQEIQIGYGAQSGLELYVNGEKKATCDVRTSRTASSVYLGDYPGDGASQSFVGYVKGVETTFDVNDEGVRLDDLEGNLIFSDVSEAHEYAEAIEYLKDEGIITGYDDGTFRAEQKVNRVEILKMLLLGFGYEVPTDESIPDFSDVEEEGWYLSYLNYALSLGVVQGYDDGTYLPGGTLNRVEFLKILTRTFGLNLGDYPITGLYPDTEEDAWYAAYVQYSKDNGLMDVDGNGNFNPGAAVTRGEVAETIYRLFRHGA